MNMICLESEDSGFFYIHRSLYDQAVLLHETYSKDRSSLKYQLCGKDYTACDFFFENAPEPINILGDFIGLLSVEPTSSDDIELLCGILSVMSMNLSFRKILTVPASVRLQLRFSLSIENEYRQSWDMFYIDSMNYDRAIELLSGAGNSSYSDGAYEEEAELSEEDRLRALFDTPVDFSFHKSGEEIPEREAAPKREDFVPTVEGTRPSDKLKGWMN